MVPLGVVADNRDTFYGYEAGACVRAIRKKQLRPKVLVHWLQDMMDWDDIEPFATKIKSGFGRIGGAAELWAWQIEIIGNI